MKKAWTLVIDTREKVPLHFPAHLVVLDDKTPPLQKKAVTVKLSTVKERLKTGDYLLQGHRDQVLVERKGSLREVAQNCLSGDRDRFLKSLERMRDECRVPILFLEGSITKFLGMPSKELGDIQPELCLDALIRLTLRFGIHLFIQPTATLSQRRRAGEMVARFLLAGAVE